MGHKTKTGAWVDYAPSKERYQKACELNRDSSIEWKRLVDVIYDSSATADEKNNIFLQANKRTEAVKNEVTELNKFDNMETLEKLIKPNTALILHTLYDMLNTLNTLKVLEENKDKGEIIISAKLELLKVCEQLETYHNGIKD